MAGTMNLSRWVGLIPSWGMASGEIEDLGLAAGIPKPLRSVTQVLKSVGSRYNSSVRKKSGLGEAKRQSLIEQARRMTPEQRLDACVRLSAELAEIHRAGAAHRGRTTPGRS